MKKQFCIVILLLSNSIAHLLMSVLVTVLGMKEAVVLVFSPASLICTYKHFFNIISLKLFFKLIVA